MQQQDSAQRIEGSSSQQTPQTNSGSVQDMGERYLEFAQHRRTMATLQRAGLLPPEQVFEARKDGLRRLWQQVTSHRRRCGGCRNCDNETVKRALELHEKIQAGEVTWQTEVEWGSLSVVQDPVAPLAGPPRQEGRDGDEEEDVQSAAGQITDAMLLAALLRRDAEVLNPEVGY